MFWIFVLLTIDLKGHPHPFILKYFEDNEFLMININESNIFEKYDFIDKYIDLKNSIYNYNALIKD